jgi:hypothetical protein
VPSRGKQDVFEQAVRPRYALHLRQSTVNSSLPTLDALLEIRMTKETRIFEIQTCESAVAVFQFAFGFWHSFDLRHSGFVIIISLAK